MRMMNAFIGISLVVKPSIISLTVKGGGKCHIYSGTAQLSLTKQF